jgi:transcriptional regulator with XRE-family HTH domain
MENQFGDKIRQLREGKNLLQRQVASMLEIDTPMLSKIERGERKARKEQVVQFAGVFNTNKDELLTLWLADQLYDVAKDEEVALKAIQMTERKIKIHKNIKRNQ